MQTYEAFFLKNQGVLVHFAKSDYEWEWNQQHIPEAQDDGTMVYIYFESEVDILGAELIAKMHFGDYISSLS